MEQQATERDRKREVGGFREIVWEIVRMVPKGKVTTYGRVAELAGVPRGARAVGWMLHYTPEEAQVPCQRVVKRYGGLAGAYGWGGVYSHRADLANDGVEVRDDFTVELDRYLWKPDPEVQREIAARALRYLTDDSRNERDERG